MTAALERATEAALGAIDRSRDDILALLAALVPLGIAGEADLQAAVAARLAALGAAVEARRYEPARVPLVGEFAAAAALAEGERIAVVGRFPGHGGGRSLLLFAHPDGEPLPAEPGWGRDPLSATLEGGRLHGWGVADDLSGVAIALSAMAAIAGAGIALAGTVVVASTPSKRHARGIAAVLAAGVAADAALYLHPAESGAGMADIKALASGLVEFSVTVAGRAPDTAEPGHTAFAHQAVHPLDKALLLIGALRRLDAARAGRIRHPLLEAAVGRSTNLLVSAMRFGDEEQAGRLPERLSFTASISFPPGETLAAVKSEVEAALAEAVAADPFLAARPPALRWLSGVTGSEVPETHPLYRSLAAAIRSVAGIEPRINPMHTSSDIRNPLVQKGIPALGFGPLCGDLVQAGGKDEWVDAEDHLAAVKVAAAAIIGWCGVAGDRAATAGDRR